MSFAQNVNGLIKDLREIRNIESVRYVYSTSEEHLSKERAREIERELGSIVSRADDFEIYSGVFSTVELIVYPKKAVPQAPEKIAKYPLIETQVRYLDMNGEMRYPILLDLLDKKDGIAGTVVEGRLEETPVASTEVLELVKRHKFSYEFPKHHDLHGYGRRSDKP